MIYELPISKRPELFENMVFDLANYLFNTKNFSIIKEKDKNMKPRT